MRGLLNAYGISLPDRSYAYAGWNKPAPASYYFPKMNLTTW